MADNPGWFNGLIPTIPENATIAQSILATTAAMRKDGSFGTTSLCWDPAELELLATFAIGAKNELAHLKAKRARRRSSVSPSTEP
jgi:hypothetical protein